LKTPDLGWGDWWTLSRAARDVPASGLRLRRGGSLVDGALVPEEISDDPPDVEPDVKSREDSDTDRDLTPEPRSPR
jgi:hypothetical protein